MFTGIVEAVGHVVSVEPRGGDIRLTINNGKLDMSDVILGESIATNGVCLTVVEKLEQGYVADVSQETLKLTTIAEWVVNSRVNLEKSITLQSRLGGHMVSGHVDGIAEVIRRETDARAEQFWIKAPAHLARYIAHKGSVTIDGTSLTVNAVNGDEFALTIVPHTLEETIIGDYVVGTHVNIEVDLIARYLERIHLGEQAAQKLS